MAALAQAFGLSKQDLYGFSVACAYGVVSIAITFFNKATFEVYRFQASSTLTVAQMAIALALLWALHRGAVLQLQPVQRAMVVRTLPLGVAFAVMVATGLAGLKYINVPLYGALRRITTFVVMAMEGWLLQRHYPADERWSVYLMVVGALVAAGGDMMFSFWGYFHTLLNCLVTALYLVLIAKLKKETPLSTWDLMLYNNLVALPLMLLLVLATELPLLAAFEHWRSAGFWFFFVMSCLQAFALNYLIFLCSTVNSPLTTSITGQLKAVLQTLIGLVLFGDVVYTLLWSLGLFISSAASVWYGYIKYAQSAARASAAVTVEPPKQKSGGDNV